MDHLNNEAVSHLTRPPAISLISLWTAPNPQS